MLLVSDGNGQWADSTTKGNEMNNGTKQNNREPAVQLPAWADCDAFCIHDYAGTGAQPCRWRGRFADARPNATGAKVLCPRCGCPTLFQIPSNRSER